MSPFRSFFATRESVIFCPPCDNWAVSPTLQVFLAVIGIAVIWFALVRFFRYAGRRGWVFNKHNPKPSHPRSIGILEQVYQPSIQHVIEFEITDRTDAEQDESGEPPEPGESGERPEHDNT